MKIVYCIAATYNSGGMERVLSCKANHLVQLGHEVSIVTTDQKGRPSFFDFDSRIHFYDLAINYEENNGRSFFHKAYHFPQKQKSHKRKLTQLLTQLQADIVISMFNNEVNFIADIADGSKKVLEIHFSKNKKLHYGRKGLWRLADWWRTRQEEKLVRKFNKFVVLTHEDAALWGDLDNLVVIPNPRTFQPSQRANLASKQILAIGRYEYQKGFDRLLNIWAKIDAKIAEGWTLKIVGGGPDKEKLEQQIYHLGIQDRVCLEPPTANVESLYHHSSIFAMTSRYEGLPMVLLEAQACGLPIISYAIQCGPKDLIAHGKSGFLITDNDIDCFTHHLSTLIQDTQLRQKMGATAYQNSTSFTEAAIMKQWTDLLHSLIPA